MNSLPLQAAFDPVVAEVAARRHVSARAMSAASLALCVSLTACAGAEAHSTVPEATASVSIEPTPQLGPATSISKPHEVTGDVTDATNYFYVGGFQYVKAEGASVDIAQAQPVFAEDGGVAHSVMELAVESNDGKQIVEVGWKIDDTEIDTKPRLFVYRWIDSVGACYNACGFVQTGAENQLDNPVKVGVSGNFEIKQADKQWQIFYNGDEVGYYPDALWKNSFTTVGITQVFGEVAGSTAKPCTDMGNGRFGTKNGAALIDHYNLFGADNSPSLTPYADHPTFYNFGDASDTSMRIGGPGAC